MDEKEVNFSLSYEQLTRIAEERIRECELDNQGAKYISESSKASALLGFWYELAITGAPVKIMNKPKRSSTPISSASENSSGRRLISNDSGAPTIAAAAAGADCTGRPRGAPSRNTRAYPPH